MSEPFCNFCLLTWYLPALYLDIAQLPWLLCPTCLSEFLLLLQSPPVPAAPHPLPPPFVLMSMPYWKILKCDREDSGGIVITTIALRFGKLRLRGLSDLANYLSNKEQTPVSVCSLPKSMLFALKSLMSSFDNWMLYKGKKYTGYKGFIVIMSSTWAFSSM